MTWKQRRLALPTLLLVVAAAACIGSSENSDPASPAAGSPASPSPSPSNEAKVEGAIAALGGACPNLSFAINGQRILTNSGTRFEHAACSALRNGMQIEVEGARQADGAILAQKAERKDEEQEQQEVEFKGPVASLAGACPILSFSISGQRVVTNSNTRFDKISCGDVRNTVQVEVEGLRQGDGSVMATKVKRDD